MTNEEKEVLKAAGLWSVTAAIRAGTERIKKFWSCDAKKIAELKAETEKEIGK